MGVCSFLPLHGPGDELKLSDLEEVSSPSKPFLQPSLFFCCCCLKTTLDTGCPAAQASLQTFYVVEAVLQLPVLLACPFSAETVVCSDIRKLLISLSESKGDHCLLGNRVRV